MTRVASSTWWLGLAVVLLSSGCELNGEGSPGGLTRVGTVEPGEDCAQGGVAVSVGADADGDGLLSDDEVASTQFVCNGATGEDGDAGEDGHSTLIETAEEAPGEHCEQGGVVVESGLDLDDDGLLDPGEVTSIQYVCDGEDGA